VIFGKTPPLIPSYFHGQFVVDVCESLPSSRDEVLGCLKMILLKAQGHMKAMVDRKRRDVSFAMNTWVYVKLQPYLQTS